MRSELLRPCPVEIAQPLTTADPFDLARALTQSSRYGKDCAKKHRELIDAVRTRQSQ